MKKRKVISLLLIVAMLLMAIPVSVSAAAKADTNTITIKAQASYGKNGFDMLPQNITVKANLAQEYGYDVAKNKAPTVFDALTAMHIQKYGAAFKESPKDYLDIKSSTLRKAFGKDAASSGFYVNGEFPADDQGTGYPADSALLKDGDELQFWIYTDPSGLCFDFFTYFDKKSITLEEGQALSLQLTGYMAMGEMYADMGYVDPKDSKPQPIYDEKGKAAVYTIKDDGSLDEKLGEIKTTDGVFKTSQLKAGSYKLTASGSHNKMPYYTLILPYCEVDVLPSGTITNVENLIKAIGKVSINSKAKIVKARHAYNALSAAGKKLISNAGVLTKAETTYAKLEKANVISKKTIQAKAVSVTYNKVKVTWDKISGAAGYQLYRATSRSGSYKKLTTTTKNSYTNSGLKTGKTYYYKVKGYTKAEGYTFYSKTSSVKSVKVKPATVQMKTKAGKKKISVSWKKVAGADKYQLYRAGSKNGNYIKIRETVQTHYTDRSLKSGKTYFYKARALKKVSGKKIYGSFSAVKHVKAK